MAEENSDVKEVSTSGGKKKSPVIWILGIFFVVLLIGGGAAGYFIFVAPKDTAAEKASTSSNAPQAQPQVQSYQSGIAQSGPIKKMESFIVNLTDAQGTRYLKVNMQMEMSNEML